MKSKRTKALIRAQKVLGKEKKATVILAEPQSTKTMGRCG